MPNGLQIREMDGDAEIGAAQALMVTLRRHLLAESFVEQVRRQQRDGYRLVGGFADGVLVALAGIRDGCTLSRGPHVFVDDLVTDAAAQGKGHGRAMLRWIAEDARRRGLPKIWLDSRATAKGFYEKVGFTFITAIPCWIDVDALL